ncbi:MarR family winged helix-turn-helix transcriptional regulator [Flavobacterium johnsoniae]|uniref:Transcriptional regulator, MarR family n=1 Tax=Flavobacterium johnsoniae (strain ATCC 17061 / DSM 2064 / JCM 8514 / BCRC 14874 / CCUG 350202 / NBRC 14942 / NCIMB 11054 / UW101) TaxID=376686 RepID=A5FCC6_FLAJ1|nr:MarR family winged helix-turn-helix transcriptional regulator [Flavobacterium johnsoniae]ABQ07147.1 transcriptional regulator, MarR family [Flavobacterium johnsoniae UW101]OXE98862.1 MarR family transcriptional regulator [Flavobacterium johnsoniae UW101]WQG81014.1 MarR family winged helix-turn-helix transcriptional regulator [Flavobacterium johnsoniae UW101]SHL29025.1 transcriptional regulator [Flavobacterium johnsoniae]
MKNIFNLETQNNNLDGKITAGFERLSQVFRVLLWEKAKKYDLSPIQIQLLIFIKHHAQNRATVSYIAKEFNLTKATISDTIKILEQKKYITKTVNTSDSRSSTIELTTNGLEMVLLTEDFTDPLFDLVSAGSQKEKLVLWKTISSLIQQLQDLQLINVQSTCYNCGYFVEKNENNYCKLLDAKLETSDIRLDCFDHKPVRL